MTIFASSHRFKKYLKETIIPDSREAGYGAYADDLQEALTWLNAYSERYGEIVVDNEEWVKVGARVTLKQDVERFPHFTVPAGSSGYIVEADDDGVYVNMDDHIPGAEHWGNRVLWQNEDRERFLDDCRAEIRSLKRV